MFGLETLDILIGLVTVYLVFGLACTAIVEAVAAWLNVRSRNLEMALEEFLAGDFKEAVAFVNAFYGHPLVQALSKGKDGRPSYIPPEIVAQVVEALLTKNDPTTSLAAAVNALPGTPATNRIKGLLEALVTQARGDAAAFRKAVETHFNAAMDRASGWFKRHTQNVALVAAAVLVVAANVDTVELAKSLASNPAARLKMVEIADQNLRKAESAETELTGAEGEEKAALEQAQERSGSARRSLDDAVSALQSAAVRFGWTGFPPGVSECLAKAAGLLVSILAVSLGAPFWFDVLKRFMQVRAAGALPQEPTKPQQPTDEKK